MTHQYDAIIVGGRNAGSSLAIRLAEQGLSVLLVDRASFPSLPQVPSSPMIHAGTMRLLDELGLDESEYASPGGLITEYALTFVGHFQAFFPTAVMGIDRNYSYGVDRNRFDAALWGRATKTPGVTAWSRFTANDVLWEGDRVTGIVGTDADGKEVRATAGLVVGADGRFSWAARQFGAKVVEEHNEYIGSSYHADWQDVAPISPEHPQTVGIYNTAKGRLVLTIPIGPQRYTVANYLTMDKANAGGGQTLEANYLESLRGIPEVWARLKHATKVSECVGVKGIKNGYRAPYGKGWALVGDAVHYKDPIDGQGIYDALLSSKLLAEAVQRWRKQGASFEDAMQFYQDEFWRETHAMYLQTVERVKKEIYSKPPPFIINTLLRWMMTDPEYQLGFLRHIHRAIQPNERPSLHPKYIWRGLWRDLTGQGQGAPAQLADGIHDALERMEPAVDDQAAKP